MDATRARRARRDLFEVETERDHLGNLGPLSAIFPRGEAPVVRRGEDGARQLVCVHWGFPMPQRSKRTGEPILPKAVNNARDDTLLASPFWRESYEQRRCLVPATAFSEVAGRRPAIHTWFALPPGDGVDEAARLPLEITGFWRHWRGQIRDVAVAGAVLAYTVVTTTPNAVVAPVHFDRMVATLPHEDWQVRLTALLETALAGRALEGGRQRRGAEERRVKARGMRRHHGGIDPKLVSY